MAIKAYHIKIKGLVTGIGFRCATLSEAGKYQNILGYVRNVCRSEVEVVIQGDEYDTQCIITWLHHGPEWSRIDDIKINELPITATLPHFKITY
jgi:acylphosphatase